MAGNGIESGLVTYSPEALAEIVNGCSGGLDAIARFIHRLRGQSGGLAFSPCCDEHDLFYEQGGSRKDRSFADKVLRACIAANLKKRGRPWWARVHVPWVIWAAVRLFGWWYWGR